MKLNVCKEFTPMDPNEKTIASLQPNVSPRRYNLKFQTNETNFEDCSAQQYFKNKSILQSVSIFFIFGHQYLLLYFLCHWKVLSLFSEVNFYFTEIEGHFRCLNFAKIRDTVPLMKSIKDMTLYSQVWLSCIGVGVGGGVRVRGDGTCD